jgi:ferredoxin
MTYIIAKDCVDLMDGACVDVCPVDCIYSKPLLPTKKVVYNNKKDNSLMANIVIQPGFFKAFSLLKNKDYQNILHQLRMIDKILIDTGVEKEFISVLFQNVWKL